MQRIIRAFDIDHQSAYQCILQHGNRISLQLLETDARPFDNVVHEILETKRKLLSDEFIIEELRGENKIPFTRDSFIYYLYDDEILVYIGKTNNISARVGTHVLENKKEFNRVGYKTVEKSIISLVEEVNIYRHTPKYNILVWDGVDFFKNVLKMCVFE